MQGKTKVDLQVAPITPKYSDFKLSRLELGIAFTHEEARCEEVWKRGGVVAAPLLTNTTAILNDVGQMKLSHDNSQTSLAAADGMLHMNLKRGAALKRKEAGGKVADREKKKTMQGDVCKAEQSHSVDSLEQVGQLELRAECGRHGLPQYGTNGEMKARLKEHYNAVKHAHKPGGASSDSASTFYDTTFPMEKKVSLLDHWPKKV